MHGGNIFRVAEHKGLPWQQVLARSRRELPVARIAWPNTIDSFRLNGNWEPLLALQDATLLVRFSDKENAVNAAWLLKSSTLWGTLVFSGVISVFILIFSPDGLPSLHKRGAELRAYTEELRQKNRHNRELADEVRRLAAKDPELFEGLARRQGYARPGETVYTFHGESH